MNIGAARVSRAFSHPAGTHLSGVKKAGGFVCAAIFLISASFAFAEAAPVAVPLDTNSSVISWVGKKVTGEHRGTVRISSGEALLSDGVLVGGNFNVDLSSIRVGDIDDPEDNQKLTKHLKSEDFFAASLYPAANFTITKAEAIPGAKAGAANYKVVGDLSIKGIKREVQFPVTVVMENGKARATAKFELDRTKWGVRYGSGQFFENLGDKLIYDNFEVAFDVNGAIPQS